MANCLCRDALASCIGVVTVNNAHGASIVAAAIVLVYRWLGMAKGIIDAPSFLLHPSLRSPDPIYGISKDVDLALEVPELTDDVLDIGRIIACEGYVRVWSRAWPARRPGAP